MGGGGGGVRQKAKNSQIIRCDRQAYVFCKQCSKIQLCNLFTFIDYCPFLREIKTLQCFLYEILV